MAAIVRISYQDDYYELVPIWSGALSRELKALKIVNKDIKDIKVINEYASEDECEYFDSLIKRTVYKLPKEYKETRRKRV